MFVAPEASKQNAAGFVVITDTSQHTLGIPIDVNYPEHVLVLLRGVLLVDTYGIDPVVPAPAVPPGLLQHV